jgi:PAS domain S-box-containing protein
MSASDPNWFYILGALGLVVMQGAMLAWLVVERRRRRRAELALRESERHFRVMADTAPVLVWRSGIDKACDFFNQSWRGFRGRTQEQERGAGWAEGVHPDDLEECLRIYGSAFDARTPFAMDYRLQRADGEYRWVLDTGVPRYDEHGQFAGYVGSAIDITERKAIEVRNRDLAGWLISAQETERRRIARDLHDDLSQHLAGLSIMLSTLKRSVGNPGSQTDVDRTFTTLQSRAAALAETVTHLSHELHPRVLEYGGLVPALRRHCDEVQRRHHLPVTFTAGDDLEGLSPNVALCLFRVSQEALTNAVQHAHARTIRVQLRATPEQVELGVIDDGIGFVSGGAGGELGLRSMDERARLLRGRVTVESRPGHGTALMARIPRRGPELESGRAM